MGPPIDPKDLPPNVSVLKFDTVSGTKRNGTAKIRAIVNGYRMTQGLDYNETFAPIPCMTSIRLLLALTAKYDWEAKQGDVHTAFLAAPMDAKVIVAVPNWFTTDASATMTGYTYRLALKAINGVPQGPHLFSNKTNNLFRKLGLRQCRSEPCLFYHLDHHLFLIVWVDDLFLFFPTSSSHHAAKLWKGIQAELDLEDMADIDDCLACIVRRDRPNHKLTLTQEPAARKLLLRLNMSDCSATDTPMVANVKLTKKDCPSAEEAAVRVDEQRWYRSTVASLIYFGGWTRPDLAYAVSKLCKFMHNPGRVHIIALKRTLRYLNATANYGLSYDFSKNKSAKTGIYGYYDASHADCPDTMRSTLGYTFYFERCIISWHTKLHTVITTSTNHSEFCAAAKAAKEAKWLTKMMVELGFSQFVKPIDLFSDSKGAIAMAYNPVFRAASKHIALADHYAREQQQAGVITISHLSTHDMIADILTKPLPRESFARFASEMIAPVQL